MHVAVASSGTPAAGTLYYTTFAGGPNVKSVPYSYDGSALTLGSTTIVATTPGADGLVFAPDGDLLVGGQADRVHKVNKTTGTFATKNAGGTSSFHLAMDPSGTKVWSAGIPGGLASVPLTPFANGTAHTLAGPDEVITSLAFDTAGNAYYTSSGAGGFGTVGRINLTTFNTTRTLSGIAAAHGMAFDSFTGHLLLFGSDQVTQIDPTTMAVISTLTVPGAAFDQGTADGKGHIFVANNYGYLLFVDYSNTHSVGAAGNYVAMPFVDNAMDDVAPLSGPGSCAGIISWGAPLSDATPYNMHIGESVPIKFGLCGTFVHDDSVIINVMDIAHPNSAITTYVEGGDIVIDDVAGEYRQTFTSSRYALTAGQTLKVQIYFGDQLLSEATINVVP
jgi:hypothetical protein